MTALLWQTLGPRFPWLNVLHWFLGHVSTPVNFGIFFFFVPEGFAPIAANAKNPGFFL